MIVLSLFPASHGQLLLPITHNETQHIERNYPALSLSSRDLRCFIFVLNDWLIGIVVSAF